MVIFLTQFSQGPKQDAVKSLDAPVGEKKFTAKKNYSQPFESPLLNLQPARLGF
jgi:hypothetical protein